MVFHQSIHFLFPPPLFVVVDVDDNFFVLLHRFPQVLNFAIFFFKRFLQIQITVLRFGAAMRLATRTARQRTATDADAAYALFAATSIMNSLWK